LLGAVRWLLPLLLLLPTATAHAEDDEWALSLGPAVTGLSEAIPDDGSALRWAPGVMARLRYGVGDFFQLGGALDVGLGLPNDTSGLGLVAAAFVEAHYVIDIVTWVPFVSLGAGVLVRDEVPGEGLRADLALALGGGLEYRPARAYAFGFTGRYELVVTDFDRADAFSLALVYTLFFE
jgi:hypothetical protein